MTAEYIELIREALIEKQVELAAGLSDAEVAEVESAFGFRFPPDLKLLLQTFLPLGQEFPNWRKAASQQLLDWMDEPAEGIAFDVEENDFWLEGWGERPDDPDDAVEEAHRLVALAPILIPVFAHRYLPSRPVAEGNPVLSVMQSDVIVFGGDLGWYFHREFGAPEPSWSEPEPREIEFWSGVCCAE